MKKWIILVSAASLFAALPIAIGAPQAKGLSEWKPIQVEMRYQGSPKQKGTRLELHFTTAPGWEITSNAPEDESAFPCRIEIKSPGLVFGAPRWPTPRRERVAELGFDKTLFGGQFTVTLPVRAVGKYDTTATRGVFHFQACQGKMCLAPDSLSFQMK